MIPKGYTKDKFTGQLRLKALTKLIGAKTKLRDQIYQLMPEHDAYYEPFGGSFTVLIGKDKVAYEQMGDISPDVINFYRCVKLCPDKLWAAVQSLLPTVSAVTWDTLRKSLHPKPIEPLSISGDIKQSAIYYIINKACMNGIVRFNGNGECNSTYCGTLEGRGWMTEEWLMSVHERLKGVLMYNQPWQHTLSSSDLRNFKNSFIYLDPPYYEVFTSYDKRKFAKADHKELYHRLALCKAKWLLSINDHPDIRKMYDEFNIKEVQTSWSCSQTIAGRGKKIELLISNY